MCPAALKVKLDLAAEQGKLPKVIIPVHFGGAAPDMKAISRLASQFEIKIIEDASHALGDPTGDAESEVVSGAI